MEKRKVSNALVTKNKNNPIWGRISVHFYDAVHKHEKERNAVHLYQEGRLK